MEPLLSESRVVLALQAIKNNKNLMIRIQAAANVSGCPDKARVHIKGRCYG
jgi:hypothetical protein